MIVKLFGCETHSDAVFNKMLMIIWKKWMALNMGIPI